MYTILRRTIGILALFLVSLLGAGTPKAMIIFDASGSMWGQIDGVNKIVIARDALKSVVGKWNPHVQLGLTVYGHRVKGDCNDIQTVIPIGPVHKKQMIDTVMGILPKGMTPIAKSLRQVANSLRQYEDQTTIILISDGKESCDADPCATAKQLKAEGINFVAHVVGFNVNAATDRQLACIAHATGGEYFSAKNAAALNKAIKVIAKKVEKPKPKSKPVSQNTTLELIARLSMSPTALNVSGMQWKATQKGKILYSGDKEAPKVPAKVGKVHIEAVYARTSDVQKVAGDVTLKPKKNNPIIIQLKSAKVTIDTAEEQGGPKVKSSVRIYPILNGQPNMDDEIAWCVPTKSKACERVLPTGDFFIQATYSDMKTQKQITLGNKEKKSIHLYFKQTGKVYITARETEGGKLVGSSCRIYNDDKSDWWNLSARKKNPQGNTRQLPVGKYTVNCSYNEFKRENVPLEIKAGETSHVDVVFGQTGKVYITARETEGGKLVDASCRIYNDDKSDWWNLSARKKNPQGNTRQLPVGKYTVNCSYNEFKRENVPLEIKAGETSHVDVVFGQTGNVYITARETEGGKLVDASCRIYNDDKSDWWNLSARKKNPQGNTRQLPVGKYTVNCSYNEFKRENVPLEIKAGETSHVDVVFGQTGKVYITARETEGGKLVGSSCRIYNDDKSDWWNLSARKKNPQGNTRQLPVGKYTVNCSHNDFQRKNVAFEIKAGETAHVDMLFPAFSLQSKCSNPKDRVSYEIYAKSGELVYDNNVPCSKKLKVTLSEGTYSIEGKVKETKATTAITVYPKENHGALLDFTQQNHAAVIQADTQTKPQTTTPSTPKPVQQKIQDLNQAADAITKTVNDHKDDLKKMGDLLNALGGLMGGKQQQTSPAPSTPKSDTDLNVSDDDLQLFSK